MDGQTLGAAIAIMKKTLNNAASSAAAAAQSAQEAREAADNVVSTMVSATVAETKSYLGIQ